jgi:hypothetical protein
MLLMLPYRLRRAPSRGNACLVGKWLRSLRLILRLMQRGAQARRMPLPDTTWSLLIPLPLHMDLLWLQRVCYH